MEVPGGRAGRDKERIQGKKRNRASLCLSVLLLLCRLAYVQLQSIPLVVMKVCDVQQLPCCAIVKRLPGPIRPPTSSGFSESGGCLLHTHTGGPTHEHDTVRGLQLCRFLLKGSRRNCQDMDFSQKKLWKRARLFGLDAQLHQVKKS